jgi:hypothetical protein
MSYYSLTCHTDFGITSKQLYTNLLKTNCLLFAVFGSLLALSSRSQFVQRIVSQDSKNEARDRRVK